MNFLTSPILLGLASVTFMTTNLCFFSQTFYFVLGYSELTNNAVKDSGAQQRDSAIHTHISILQTPLPREYRYNCG